jgi:hypothetical protein
VREKMYPEQQRTARLYSVELPIPDETADSRCSLRHVSVGIRNKS